MYNSVYSNDLQISEKTEKADKGEKVVLLDFFCSFLISKKFIFIQVTDSEDIISKEILIF